MTTKFYDPADPMPAALTLVGAVVLAGTLGYVALVPVPTKKGIVATARMRERDIQAKIDDAREREKEIATVMAKRKSSVGVDQIGPDALARITRLVENSGLKLNEFRPQRPTESTTGVTIYPYTISVEGTFPATAKFVRTIETTMPDIAVTAFSSSPSDGESSNTAARIAIALFADTPKPASSRPAAGTSGARGTATTGTTTNGTTTSGTTATGTTGTGATNG